MIANLRWSETADSDSDPAALAGSLSVQIVGDDGVEVASLDGPISGAPETLDDQFDALLSAAGWRRVSELRCWWGTLDRDGNGNGEGQCEVVQA